MTVSLRRTLSKINPELYIERPISYAKFDEVGHMVSDQDISEEWGKIAHQQLQIDNITVEEMSFSPLGRWLLEASKGGGRILDYHCGTGLFSLVLKNLTGHYYEGLERQKIFYTNAKARWYNEVKSGILHFELGDFNKQTSYAPGSFHIVWTYNILSNAYVNISSNSYETSQDLILKEIAKLVQIQGHYICIEKSFTGVPDDYSDGRAFTLTGWKERMSRYGFALNRNYDDCFHYIRVSKSL